MLVKALPSTALIWAVVAEQNERAKKPTREQIKKRTEHYKRKAKGVSV